MRRAESDRLLAMLADQQIAFDEERQRWEGERTRLVNALLAKTAGEFSLRQKVTAGPTPISDVPREAREPQVQPMGL